jgi:hypothetical protein
VLLGLTQLCLASDQLAFVYQLVRHGARAALVSYPHYPFSVPEGFLTSQGMRQRFMLGTFNRERYVEDYGLLDPEYNPS